MENTHQNQGTHIQKLTSINLIENKKDCSNDGISGMSNIGNLTI